MTLLGGIIIAVCACSLGIIIGGLMAGGKCKDLQNQLALKREAWCRDCNVIAEVKACRETIGRDRISHAAQMREKQKKLDELNRKNFELREKLENQNRQQGIEFLTRNVARG